MNKNKMIAVSVGMVMAATTLVPLAACAPTEETQHTHTYEVTKSVDATCEDDGYKVYSCTGCDDTYEEKTADKLGHDYADASLGYRYLIPCKRAGCTSGIFSDSEASLKDKTVYSFTTADKTEIDALYEQIKEAIQEVGDYVDGKVYDESSDVYEKWQAFSALYKQYSDKMDYVSLQYDNAELNYKIDITDEQNSANLTFIKSYYADVQANYYGVYELVSTSQFKDYFFEGWSEEQQTKFLKSLKKYNKEINALNEKNDAIAMEFNTLSDVDTSDRVLELYSQFVENNKQLATLYGYDNYMNYAYKELYGRDYKTEDLSSVVTYIKKYISPQIDALFAAFSAADNAIPNATIYKDFTDVSISSPLDNVDSNRIVNNYLNYISNYSVTGLNYADIVENAFKQQLVFTGNYQGAITNSLDAIEQPVSLFGNGEYSSSFTFIHEFGHYFNFYYNYAPLVTNGTLPISFDLSETHSHSMELMFLSYAKSQISPIAYHALTCYKLATYAANIVNYMAMNLFEQAVYTESYSGKGADEIMADGEITKDEYDKLYSYILEDLDFGQYASTYSIYWRMVGINQPCYYTSYSVSLIGSMQLYTIAENQGLQTAVQHYNKLITYSDSTNAATMTYADILHYAGLYSISEEQLYKDLTKTLSKLSGVTIS